MNDKLLLPPGTSLENLHALRDALTDALNSSQITATTPPPPPATTASIESCTGNPLTPLCQSTLSGDNRPVLSKRKLHFNPGLAGLNVSNYSNITTIFIFVNEPQSAILNNLLFARLRHTQKQLKRIYSV